MKARCSEHGLRDQDGHGHGRCNAIVRREHGIPILCSREVTPVCSNCGRPFEPIVRCATCKRQFCCGSLSAPCDRGGCGESVMALQYESAEDAAEDADLFVQEPPRPKEPPCTSPTV